ncbi:xylulokinase [Candidatus Bathyarchaeota archaeon]|nr:MAG: xylulokinase [Candidatus Bathyarchaeota archaeon]
MKGRYILTIEIGTTACKVIIFDDLGRKIVAYSKEHPTFTPRVGWAEQDPRDWESSVVEGVRSVLGTKRVSASEISVVSITGQMHSAVPVDKTSKPLLRCIILTDRRSSKQCEAVSSEISPSEIYRITGNRLDPYITAPKLLWIKDNQPRVFEKTYKFLPPKDFIRLRLTDVFATEPIDASGSLLYNIRTGEWSTELLKIFGIPEEKMPEIHEPTEVIGEITEKAAQKTHLEKGTPVVVGGADDIDILGTGAIQTGLASGHLGSSGEIAVCVDNPIFDPLGRVECYPHVIKSLWVVGGPISNAGTALRWLKDNFAKDLTDRSRREGIGVYEILDDEAVASEPGSRGLIFLPYLTGERCPIWDPDARGVLFGLTLMHSRKEVVRAVMEGVAYSLRDVTETIERLCVKIEEIRFADRAAKSRVWRQIIADVIGKSVLFTNVEESASLGTMILGAVGIGFYKTVTEACRKTVKIVETQNPYDENHETYSKLYSLYKRLYQNLYSEFKALKNVK